MAVFIKVQTLSSSNHLTIAMKKGIKKSPATKTGLVVVGAIMYYAPIAVRPNVPQMAELPCNLGVSDFTPLQFRTSPGYSVRVIFVCRF